MKNAVVFIGEENRTNNDLFDYMAKECPEVPVITISTPTESECYDKYYENRQFHRILRPILGKRVLETCRSVIVGSSYRDEEENAARCGDTDALERVTPVFLASWRNINVKGNRRNLWKRSIRLLWNLMWIFCKAYN